MKTVIRNFSHTFRRFFTASILNLVGLSIAFTACFVILTQVDYDYNYPQIRNLTFQRPSCVYTSSHY